MKNPLVIRKSDHAIFEPSFPGSMEPPILTPQHFVRFVQLLDNAPAYYFRRLVPVKRSWWFGSKLVRSGEIWEPTDESLFDVVEKRDVLKGCQML